MNGKNLAMITARGGSKRIPRKNIKEFCGKPIIAYTIEAAKSSGVFEEIMVSTDDEEIARTARLLGANVPFFRSAENSGDYASTDDVIMEVLRAYQKAGREFDAFCCLYPTAPFLSGRRLRETGYVERQFPEYANARSQDLPKIYHDCGQFYACRTDAFLQAKTTDVPRLFPLILTDLEVQDIDTPEDWTLAEMKYRLLHGENI